MSSIAVRLANLAEGLDANGVLSAEKGGTGTTTGGGGGAAKYVKTYYWKGGLTENTGTIRHYVPVATSTLTTINAYLATPGLTQSTVVVKKNGVAINTIIFAANATSNLQSALSVALSSSDYLTVDITQSSNAVDLYINFVYEG